MLTSFPIFHLLPFPYSIRTPIPSMVPEDEDPNAKVSIKQKEQSTEKGGKKGGDIDKGKSVGLH